jgi:hypothetical protein
MWFSHRLVLATCLSLASCAIPRPDAQPDANQTPQLSHKDELAAFEAIVRYKLAQIHFPRGDKVYVQALEIFPTSLPRPAPVQELPSRFHDRKIVVISDDNYHGDSYLEIYLNSTDGSVYYFSVQDHDHANTFRLEKRNGRWIVIGVDPVVMT